MRFRKKLIALTLSCILLPLFLVTIYYQILSLQQEWIKSISYSIDQTVTVLESDWENIELIADAFCENPVVQEYLSTSSSSQTKNNQIDEYQTLQSIILPYCKNDTIYSFRVFMQEDKFYLSEQITFFPLENYSLSIPITVSGMISSPYYQIYKDRNDSEIISFIRSIPAKNSVNKIVGALAIDIRTNTFLQKLGNLKRDEFSYVGLFTSDGEEILSNGDINDKYLEFYSTDFYDHTHKRFFRKIENTDWILVCQLKNNFWGNLSLFSTNGIWISVFLLVITATTAGFIVSRLVGRMSNLIELFQPKKQISFFNIFTEINSSVENAEQVLAEQQRQIIRQQKMQLALIQAQLNPHFLYNILDHVSWLIRAGDNENAFEMILNTAKYYRLALSKGNDEISVHDDLELALTFLKIQNMGLKQKIKMEYILEKDAQSCLVPKMTIQPIIENCIRHGFRSTNLSPRIDIDIYTEEDLLFISITDNGIGFDPAKIPEIFQKNISGAGFGLYSVKQRVQLFSEKGQGDIRIETEQNKFTTVTIILSRKE